MDEHGIPCIFIADDNPNNVKVLSSMLEAKGYDTRVALNGEQALESIRQSKPDLILLDVHMPKMDGYEVCETIRNDDDLKDIRVIFISALNESFNKVQGFKLGAVDYIEKPFQIEEVEARVDTHLKLKFYQDQLRTRERSSAHRLALAAEAGSIGVWEWEVESDILIWDEKMFAIHGIQAHVFDADLKSWVNLVHESDRKRFESDFKTCVSMESSLELEFRIDRPENGSGYVNLKADLFKGDHLSAKKMVGVAMDVTDRVNLMKNRIEMENRLRQVQKMESLGTLAGGVAHDFNNLLSVILGYSDMALNHIRDPEKAASCIQRTIDGAHRAKELAKQILIFSRKKKIDKHPLRLDILIEEACNLLQPSIPKSITVEKDLSSQSKIMADSTQMHQVMINLCTNAYQSMFTQDGTLGVMLADENVSFERDILSGKLAPGNYVKLSVRDTGTGIEKDHLERIFDPYFTTKTQEEGTGLGLAVVLGIVQEHGG
ncbi:MAG: response regulator, partial [Desulfobacteraceae bacterium]